MDKAKSSNREHGGWYFCLTNILVSLPKEALPVRGLYPIPLALLNSCSFGQCSNVGGVYVSLTSTS